MSDQTMRLRRAAKNMFGAEWRRAVAMFNQGDPWVRNQLFLAMRLM
jgi:hypothetical protein